MTLQKKSKKKKMTLQPKGKDKMKLLERKGIKKQTTTKNNSKNRASVTFGTVMRKQFNFLLILDCVEHIYRNYFNIIDEHFIISIAMGLFLLIPFPTKSCCNFFWRLTLDRHSSWSSCPLRNLS